MGAAEKLLERESDGKPSETELSDDYGWSKLPSEDPDSPPVYALGKVGDGLGTLHMREVEDEDLEYDWNVVYEFIAPGEREPVSSILGEEPDVHTVDLPNNSFASRGDAERYAQHLVEEEDIGELLEEYGVRSPATRN